MTYKYHHLNARLQTCRYKIDWFQFFFPFVPLTKVQWDSPTHSSSILTTLSSSSSHRHCLPHHRPCNAHGHAMLCSIELGVIGERLVPLSLNLSLVHHLPATAATNRNPGIEWALSVKMPSRHQIVYSKMPCATMRCYVTLSWSLIVDHSFIVWYILGPMHYASIPIKMNQLEIWARFIQRLPFSWNSIISDKIWRKM